MIATIRSWLSQMAGRSIEVHPTCRAPLERIGSDYGGWAFCPELLSESSVVYCGGIGDDISFDLGLIQRFGCQVWAFDPTPRSGAWLSAQQLPAAFHFVPKGLAGAEGTLTVFPLENPGSMNHTSVSQAGVASHGVVVECVTIPGAMRKHCHAGIDLLKLDIEGSEYEVIPDLLAQGVIPPQLLVEFHHRFAGVGVPKTRQILRLLNSHGYEILAATRGAREVSFIHRDALRRVTLARTR
ncbi:MAG: FkbM family methyltransferase [Verrucomicrobiales bacterium]|nr:FkbM family methyltransferase [Verrucomicrobiales bacterium]